MIQEAQSQQITKRIKTPILDSAARLLESSALLVSSLLYFFCFMHLPALLNALPDLLLSNLLFGSPDLLLRYSALLVS